MLFLLPCRFFQTALDAHSRADFAPALREFRKNGAEEPFPGKPRKSGKKPVVFGKGNAIG